MQAPLFDQLGSPLTGYLLKYQVYDLTSTIQLPALNTSHTLDSVPTGAVYNITVSAFSDVGPSRNNPSLQLGEFDSRFFKAYLYYTHLFYSLFAVVPSLFCEDSWATPES